MKNTYLVLALMLAVTVFPVSPSAFEIDVLGYYWLPSLDGTVKVDEAAMAQKLDQSTTISLKEPLISF